MSRDYKDLYGWSHRSRAEAEYANRQYEEEARRHHEACEDATRRLHELGFTLYDIGIVVVLGLFTYFIIAHQLPLAWKNHRMQEFFMYFGGTCASWYVWYLLLKIPVTIRMVLYTIAILVCLSVGLYLDG